MWEIPGGSSLQTSSSSSASASGRLQSDAVFDSSGFVVNFGGSRATPWLTAGVAIAALVVGYLVLRK